MSQMHPSDLFNREWTAVMNHAVEGGTGVPLSLADIYSKVWTPAFSRCQSLLQMLQDHSIKLADVDWYFKQHKTYLEVQLRYLLAGVNACLGKNDSGTWIKEVVCSIHNYWDLCCYQEAASAFLALKKVLSLQGDFSVIEKLTTEVSSKSNFSGKLLAMLSI